MVLPAGDIIPRHARYILLAAFVALSLSMLEPSRAEVVPSPGKAYVANEMTLNPEGVCDGWVRFHYKLLPVEGPFRMKFVPNLDCSVDVLYEDLCCGAFLPGAFNIRWDAEDVFYPYTPAVNAVDVSFVYEQITGPDCPRSVHHSDPWPSWSHDDRYFRCSVWGWTGWYDYFHDSGYPRTWQSAISASADALWYCDSSRPEGADSWHCEFRGQEPWSGSAPEALLTTLASGQSVSDFAIPPHVD